MEILWVLRIRGADSLETRPVYRFFWLAVNPSRANAVIRMSAVFRESAAMTTIVLAHPHERCPQFQVFAIYEAPGVHHVFAVQELDGRDDAEQRAGQMMDTF